MRILNKPTSINLRYKTLIIYVNLTPHVRRSFTHVTKELKFEISANLSDLLEKIRTTQYSSIVPIPPALATHIVEKEIQTFPMFNVHSHFNAEHMRATLKQGNFT